MTDKEIAICKEIICDLNTYCALTPAIYKPMGFEFQENDFICLNNLIDLINRQKAEIERLKKPLQKLSEIGYCHNFQLERSDLVSWIYAVGDVIKVAKEMTEGEKW